MVRAPTQILYLHFQIPFDRKFSMICDNYIHKTDLADLPSLKRELDIFISNLWNQVIYN